MVSVRPEELRQALAERVARRVEGRGVPRAALDAAVTRVLDALGSRGAGGQRAAAPVIAAITARSTPDLASRVRAALGAAGVAVGDIGTAAAHGHHVATVRVPATAREPVREVAAKQGWTLSFVTEEEGR